MSHRLAALFFIGSGLAFTGCMMEHESRFPGASHSSAQFSDQDTYLKNMESGMDKFEKGFGDMDSRLNNEGEPKRIKK
jgi:hypothetical protein